MRVPLLLHPDSRSDAIDALAVDIVRSRPRQLQLRFVATGDIKHLRIPKPIGTHPVRADNLWLTTCFEAFVGPAGGSAYYEYNLAPSRDWACYRFDAPRSGMEAPNRVDAPSIHPWLHIPRGGDRSRSVERDLGGTERNFGAPFFELYATLDLSRWKDLPLDQPWRLGLSAVIEDNNGSKSYWAIGHAPGAPDFHHPDCFALELAAARPA